MPRLVQGLLRIANNALFVVAATRANGFSELRPLGELSPPITSLLAPNSGLLNIGRLLFSWRGLTLGDIKAPKKKLRLCELSETVHRKSLRESGYKSKSLATSYKLPAIAGYTGVCVCSSSPRFTAYFEASFPSTLPPCFALVLISCTGLKGTFRG